MNFSKQISDYLERLTNEVNRIDKETVNSIINLLVRARNAGKQIFIIGNGGSGANASHITGDFNKGLSLGQPREKRYRFISLTDNIPTLTSIANDVSYDNVFLEQLKNFLNPADLLIAISGSGNSENILRAVEYAKRCGNTVISFTGFNGGKLKEMSDVCIHIPICDMQITEDLHMILGHLMFSVLYHSHI